MISKQAISSRAAIVGLLILLLLLGRSKFKQWQDQREITKQKETLQAQADAQQKKNNDLNQSFEYLNSPEFKERVARQQLGLKKEGEQVYSFSDAPPSQSTTSGGTGNENPKKWRDYFFAD